LAGLRQAVEQTRARNVVISSEEFVHFLSLPDPAAAVESVISAFVPHDIKIIIYLRHPAAYLESWYNQIIKDGGAVNRFSTFFCNVARAHTDYADQIRIWSSAPGLHNILVKSYSRFGRS